MAERASVVFSEGAGLTNLAYSSGRAPPSVMELCTIPVRITVSPSLDKDDELLILSKNKSLQEDIESKAIIDITAKKVIRKKLRA